MQWSPNDHDGSPLPWGPVTYAHGSCAHGLRTWVTRCLRAQMLPGRIAQFRGRRLSMRCLRARILPVQPVVAGFPISAFADPPRGRLFLPGASSFSAASDSTADGAESQRRLAARKRRHALPALPVIRHLPRQPEMGLALRTKAAPASPSSWGCHRASPNARSCRLAGQACGPPQRHWQSLQ